MRCAPDGFPGFLRPSLGGRAQEDGALAAAGAAA
jgi:hypothetical protein